jgi:hypothetical protein
VRLASREQLYRLEHLRPFRWNSGQSFLVRATKCSNSPAILVMAGKDDKWVMIKGEGSKRTREDTSDDPKHALGLVEAFKHDG